MALTLTGCASLEKRLIEVSAQKAAAEAEIHLAERPAECAMRKKEEHAPLVVGAEARVALRAERKALERQQARQDRCESFYDDVWDSY